jgi:hypothetical protein
LNSSLKHPIEDRFFNSPTLYSMLQEMDPRFRVVGVQARVGVVVAAGAGLEGATGLSSSLQHVWTRKAITGRNDPTNRDFLSGTPPSQRMAHYGPDVPFRQRDDEDNKKLPPPLGGREPRKTPTGGP